MVTGQQSNVPACLPVCLPTTTHLTSPAIIVASSFSVIYDVAAGGSVC